MSDESEAARKEAEALRQDRERLAAVAAQEAQRARRDAELADRDRARAAEALAKAERAAVREAERLQAERERAVRDAEREASRAQREAQKAATDAAVAEQRAARHLERVRRRAQDAGLSPATAEVGDLPGQLAILWRSTEPDAGRRGPRPGLTLDQITAAGIALADAEGLSALSMARVAESLGVTTMALYRYLGGKDDLVALMCDAAIRSSPSGQATERPSDASTGGSPGWRARIEDWCGRQYATIAEHPWLIQAFGTMPPLGPAQVALLDEGLTALRDTPLPPHLRVEVVGVLSLHVLSEGRVIAEAALMARRAAATAATDDGRADGVAPSHPALVDYGTLLRRVADPVAHPEIVALLDSGAFDVGDPAREYDVAFGLTLMLDGIAALIDRVSAGGASGRVDGH